MYSSINLGRIYHVDLSNSTVNQKIHSETKVNNFNPDDFNLEQVFLKTKMTTSLSAYYYVNIP